MFIGRRASQVGLLDDEAEQILGRCSQWVAAEHRQIGALAAGDAAAILLITTQDGSSLCVGPQRFDRTDCLIRAERRAGVVAA
jgi:hypothetical protein